MTTEQTQELAFLSDGFTYKGVKYRSLTVQDMLFLKIAQSPLFGEDMAENMLESVLDYCFVTSQPEATVKAALKAWGDSRLTYAANFLPSDIRAITELIESEYAKVASAIVEVRDEEKKTEGMNLVG